LEGGWLLPIKSVGVQGDMRSYRSVLAIRGEQRDATELINLRSEINRVVAEVRTTTPISEMRVRPATLTEERLNRLRRADAIVRALSGSSGFERQVWQFPVILASFGTESAPDCVVLRPVDSVDGMTAQSVPMDPSLLNALADELLQVPGISGVFYDLTHKPPGTIEWE
jgi:GMP synthase (glutamine-hydrolysing)